MDECSLNPMQENKTWQEFETDIDKLVEMATINGLKVLGIK